MKKRQWSLARVTKACRSAPVVWLALEQFGIDRSSPTITKGRNEIAEVSGIRDVKSISKALGVLSEAGWINRTLVPKFKCGKRSATWLRITLRRKTQKTPSTGSGPVRPKKRVKGPTRKTQKTGRSSSTKKGCGLNGPAPVLTAGSEPSRPVPYCEPQPIAGKQSVDKKTHSGGAKS